MRPELNAPGNGALAEALYMPLYGHDFEIFEI